MRAASSCGSRSTTTGRRGRPGDAPQAPRPGRRRARHRRLPLQRPPAPRRVPGDGEGPRQVPDQPWQRRREAPRRELPDDRAGGDGKRRPGPHRRQLGLAGPGAAHRPHGCQREARRAAREPRRDDRGDDRIGHALGRAGRGDRARPRSDHPVGEGLERPGRRGRVPHPGDAVRLSRCTSASPRRASA